MKFSSKCAHYLVLRNALVEKKAKPQSVLVVAAKCRHRANCLFVDSFLATSFAIYGNGLNIICSFNNILVHYRFWWRVIHVTRIRLNSL